MTDHDETWEERTFREHAEQRAWLEDAVTRLEAGLPGEDVPAALVRLAAYLRAQIADDEVALANHAAYEAGFGPEVPTFRRTRMQDRAGPELALMLITGER
ncbi:hypothetical protein [Nocardia tengchongensis]|uniref:hypothetical protein n=1 Tax=Nocardia tengchongensis TaxID=2055889 RepID=UPI0036A6CF51